MGWNIKQKIGKAVSKAVNKAVFWLSGDAALQKGISRNLGFVFYLFALVCGIIAWSLVVENDLVKVENNERIIEDLRINYQQKQLDLVGLNNRTTIDNLLKKHKSNLQAPQEPPKTIQLTKK